MKVLFLSILMGVFVYANVVGSIAQLKGTVKVQSEGSIKKSKIAAGFEINDGDLIVTSDKSAAKIQLLDGSDLVLDQKSSIHFHSGTNAEQTGGKIFYKITSRDAKNSLSVKTPFAIIGIKGTTFIVNATKDASVTLKEGLIGVQSIKEEFELYRQKVQAEFDNYVSKQQSEFQKYKDAQNKYAIAEPTKEFDLKEKHRISFFGKRVNEDSWTKEDDAEFEHFEKLINYMK
jgi:hypothetical protein